MFEVTRHTLKEKRTGIVAFSLFIFLFGIMMVAAYDSIAMNVDVDALFEEYPDFIKEFFGTIGSFGDFGGFFTLEYVQWVWCLIIPAYLALMCSGFIAGEVENKTADTLLSYPVSRRKVLLEKYASALVFIVIINFIGVIATYAGIRMYGIEYSIKWIVFAMVQATPFLLVWGAVFTLLSTVFSESKKASTYSISLIFITYFINGLSGIWSELDLIGFINPLHYFDPGKVMSLNIVSWSGTIVLILMTCVIMAATTYLFEKKDIL